MVLVRSWTVVLLLLLLSFFGVAAFATAFRGGAPRVAVLGGGLGGVLAAWEVSHAMPEAEVVVYSQGWRLGGKGATGRRADTPTRTFGSRIEEHGLHVLLGFYTTAFQVISDLYTELGRPANAPLATWNEALKGHGQVTFAQRWNNEWLPWTFDLPVDTGATAAQRQPLSGVSAATLARQALEGDQLPRRFWRAAEFLSKFARVSQDRGGCGGEVIFPGTAGEEDQTVASLLADLTSIVAKELLGDESSKDLVPLIPTLLERLRAVRAVVSDRCRRKASALAGSPSPTEVELWRDWAVLELGSVVAVGSAEDGVLEHGFEAVQQYEFMAWLRRHGASDEIANLTIVRGVYDLAFAFENGDTLKPNFSADAALAAGYGILDYIHTGAPYWKFQAGMADVLFAPFYQVLLRRGVRFEFFRRVEDLQVDSSTGRVTTIRLGVQATTPKGKEYAPLIDVNGLPAWPSDPLFDQLDQGDELRSRGVNLESSWTDWKAVAHETLRDGVDFDAVVMALPPSMQKVVAPALSRVSPRYNAMLQGVATVATSNAQLWFSQTATEMGWGMSSQTGPLQTRSQPGALISYADPLQTWMAMPQLIERETWPSPNEPKHTAYLCGVIKDDDALINVNFSDTRVPAAERARLLQVVAQNFIGTGSSSSSALLDFVYVNVSSVAALSNLLVAIPPVDASHALDLQYIRVNIDPDQRYTLSLANTSILRVPPGLVDEFPNLYAAGDWTTSATMSGNVDSTVISGITAGRAIVSDFAARNRLLPPSSQLRNLARQLREKAASGNKFFDRLLPVDSDLTLEAIFASMRRSPDGGAYWLLDESSARRRDHGERTAMFATARVLRSLMTRKLQPSDSRQDRVDRVIVQGTRWLAERVASSFHMSATRFSFESGPSTRNSEDFDGSRATMLEIAAVFEEASPIGPQNSLLQTSKFRNREESQTKPPVPTAPHLPTYESVGPIVTTFPPGNMGNTTSWLFIVPSPLRSQQELLDRTINRALSEILGPKTKRFVPLLTEAIVVWQETRDMTFMAPSTPPVPGGLFSEHVALVQYLVECQEFDPLISEWVPVGAPAMFQPALLVDNAFSLTTGREVGGFPKTLLDSFVWPEEESTSSFSVTSSVFREWRAQSRPQSSLIFKAELNSTSRPSESIFSRLKPVRDAGKLARILTRVSGWKKHGTTVDDQPTMNLVNLRNIRAAQSPLKAALSEVILFPVHFTVNAASIHPNPEDFRVTVADYASLPVGSAIFGASNGHETVLTPLMVVRMDWDLVLPAPLIVASNQK